MYRLASAPLREASSELLSELALIVWYADDALDNLQSVLDNDLDDCSELIRRRAIYLVDRLRRFPCVTNEKAFQLKIFVFSHEALKPGFRSEKANQLLSTHKLEKLAFDWGLDEDVGPQIKDVLQLQTRHFAATLERKTGYTEE